MNVTRILPILRRQIDLKLFSRSFCQMEDGMPKDLTKGQVASLRKMERKIVQEQDRIRKVKRKNVIMGIGLGTLVISICK